VLRSSPQLTEEKQIPAHKQTGSPASAVPQTGKSRRRGRQQQTKDRGTTQTKQDEYKHISKEILKSDTNNLFVCRKPHRFNGKYYIYIVDGSRHD